MNANVDIKKVQGGERGEQNFNHEWNIEEEDHLCTKRRERDMYVIVNI